MSKKKSNVIPFRMQHDKQSEREDPLIRTLEVLVQTFRLHREATDVHLRLICGHIADQDQNVRDVMKTMEQNQAQFAELEDELDELLEQLRMEHE